MRQAAAKLAFETAARLRGAVSRDAEGRRFSLEVHGRVEAYDASLASSKVQRVKPGWSNWGLNRLVSSLLLTMALALALPTMSLGAR